MEGESHLVAAELRSASQLATKRGESLFAAIVSAH